MNAADTAGLDEFPLEPLVALDWPLLDRLPTLLDELQSCLAGHFDVEHSTFQFEPAGHGDHENATHARSDSRVSGPDMSQSTDPTRRWSFHTALYGAASLWPISSPGQEVPPSRQTASVPGSKSRTASWNRRPQPSIV